MNNLSSPLTSTGQEDLDGDVLQQVAPREDGSNFRKVPFSVEVVAILEHLRTERTVSKPRTQATSITVCKSAEPATPAPKVEDWRPTRWTPPMASGFSSALQGKRIVVSFFNEAWRSAKVCFRVSSRYANDRPSNHRDGSASRRVDATNGVRLFLFRLFSRHFFFCIASRGRFLFTKTDTQKLLLDADFRSAGDKKRRRGLASACFSSKNNKKKRTRKDAEKRRRATGHSGYEAGTEPMITSPSSAWASALVERLSSQNPLSVSNFLTRALLSISVSLSLSFSLHFLIQCALLALIDCSFFYKLASGPYASIKCHINTSEL